MAAARLASAHAESESLVSRAALAPEPRRGCAGGRGRGRGGSRLVRPAREYLTRKAGARAERESGSDVAPRERLGWAIMTC